MNDDLYIGIDFGTSTNFITKWDFQKKIPVSVKNLTGLGNKPFFENAIYYESDKNFILGDLAIKKGIIEPQNLVKEIKRKIPIENWKVKIKSLNRELTVKEITRDIFKKIKELVESVEGGRKIKGSVITIPFDYNHVERIIIKEAAEEAGLNVLGLIEEPIAAALAFGLFDTEIKEKKAENILVFDLGGGTLDVTVFEFLKDGKNIEIEVKNTDGDKTLGGIDIDKMICDLFLEKLPFKIEEITERRTQKENHNKLCEEAKELKEVLSDDDEGDVIVTGLYNNSTLEIDDFPREDLDSLLKDNNFIKKVLTILENSLEDAELDTKDIDRVILVGGTSRIPYIQEELKQFLNKDIVVTDNIEELVGLGAAIYCGKLVDKSLKFKITKKVSHYIGLKENENFRTIVNKNQRYEEFSGSAEFEIMNNSKQLQLGIYEGSTKKIKDCSLIGYVQIKKTDFDEGRFRIKLGTDKSGMIKYKLFNINNKLIKEGELSSTL